MKKIRLILIVLAIFNFTFLFSSEPEWFRNLPKKDFEIIGYGSSHNLEEARSMAKKEIANSIQTQIISENTFETSEINSVVNEKANLYLKAKTDVVLCDLQTHKEEIKHKIWYVALCYENLPIEKNFANKIKIIENKNENQNKYLSMSPLIQSINDELNANLDIKLIRKNNIWYLGYENVLLPLSPNEFEKLFYSYESDNISIIPSNTSILNEGDAFSFTINSKQDGFYSIIDVYENGECFIISQNESIKSYTPSKFPKDSSSNELVAGLFDESQSTYDLYVLLFNNEKINLSRLQNASSTIEKDELHFKFNEILEMMNEYEFCTDLIRTKPKM